MARIARPDSKEDDWKKLKQDWGETMWNKKIPIIIQEFGEIVRDSRIACVGAVVDSKRFRELADQYPLFKKKHRDPIHMAFHNFVMGAIDKTEVIDRSSKIGIVIDNDRQFAMACYQQLEILKSLAEHGPQFARVKERVHSISFVNDVSYPPVQAADMIAYEARRIMVARMTNPDATSDLYDDLTFRRTHQPQFYPPEILEQLAVTTPVDEDSNDEQNAVGS